MEITVVSNIQADCTVMAFKAFGPDTSEQRWLIGSKYPASSLIPLTIGLKATVYRQLMLVLVASDDWRSRDSELRGLVR